MYFATQILKYEKKVIKKYKKKISFTAQWVCTDKKLVLGKELKWRSIYVYLSKKNVVQMENILEIFNSYL